jgi:hypothetical protein
MSSAAIASPWAQKIATSKAVIGQLDLFRKPKLIPAAPGLYVPTTPDDVPEVMLCKVIPVGNGEFRLEPFREDWLNMDRQNLRLIGMENKRNTLLRLSDGGFVECIKPSPGIWLLNLTSWYNHLRRVSQTQADGEDFWEADGDNMKLYLETARWR